MAGVRRRSVAGLGFVTMVPALVAAGARGNAATVAHEGFGDPVLVNMILTGAGHAPLALTRLQIESGALNAGGIDVFVLSRRSTVNSASTLYQSEVARYVAAGGDVVTEFTGLPMFFSGFRPPVLTSAFRTPQLGLVDGILRSGIFYRTGGLIHFVDPLHPLATGLPNPYSEGGGTENFFWIEAPDPDLQVVAFIDGTGSSAFPVGALPCLLAGCKGGSRLVLSGWDWNDTLSVNGLNRKFFLNAVAFALTPCNTAPVANPGGPYLAECAGEVTTIVLDGSASNDIDGDQLTYLWEASCDGVTFDDPTSPTPTLAVNAAAACALECFVSLTVNDGALSATAATLVSVSDVLPPEVVASATPAVEVPWKRTVHFSADDICGEAYPAAVLDIGCAVIPVADGQVLDLSRPELWCDRSGVGPQTFRLVVAAEDACGNDATSVVEWTEAPPALFVRGDADGSGQIEVHDAFAVMVYLFHHATPPSCMDACDADDDGEVDVKDAVGILHCSRSGKFQPPAPFPEAGVDPTADTLDCSVAPDGGRAPPQVWPPRRGKKSGCPAPPMGPKPKLKAKPEKKAHH